MISSYLLEIGAIQGLISDD